MTLQKEGWDQTPLAGLDKPRMELSGSNCTAKDLALAFSLELGGTCFAAGPKESGPGVVLREEMKMDDGSIWWRPRVGAVGSQVPVQGKSRCWSHVTGLCLEPALPLSPVCPRAGGLPSLSFSFFLLSYNEDSKSIRGADTRVTWCDPWHLGGPCGQCHSSLLPPF